MSRHRNVRSMNVAEEYEGYDDVYGHSVEDDYCVSPSTAAQFLYDRTQHHALATYMSSEPQIPEEDPELDDSEHEDSLQDSSSFNKPVLDDVQQAQLYSCLEILRNILGDSTPEHVLVNAVINANYDHEKALNAILCQQEAPKPQREPRRKRDKGSRVPAEPAPPTTVTAVSNDVQTAKVTTPFTVAAVGPDVSQGVARMTFSAKTQKTIGFQQPEQPCDEADGKISTQELDNEELPAVDDGKAGLSEESVSVNATPVKDGLEAAGTPSAPRSTTKSKQHRQQLLMEYEKRKTENKDHINLVVIGHVDAGKSTLMGHVLYQMGFVNKKTMHKYEQEAKKMGKVSFAYAWVLDETEEERARGVTMDIAQTRFETESKLVTLLDAPGHKDFIPNMITGAAQADVAILVVNSTRGEFETGFEMGGQTREHAMLIRSLGVSQLLVAVNKMDTVSWSEERYLEITKKLGTFLKQAGFREKDVNYVPCSGLNGENLTKESTVPELRDWYSGSCVLHLIDRFKPPERSIDKPLRMCVTDIFKGQGAGFSVAGTIQAGFVVPGDRVLVMPQGELATVKNVLIDELPTQVAFAGDNILLTLVGIEITSIGIGSIVCDRNEPIPCSTRFKSRVVIFNIDIPITRGFPVEIHYQSLTQPGYVKRLISQLHKSTGEVVKNKPRCLVKNSSAVVEIELERAICLEEYKDFKDLGRIMLRAGGHTIAAGLVMQIMKGKNREN